MKFPAQLLVAAGTVVLCSTTLGQPQWPEGGPGPYGPYAAPRYAVRNPYARELNALAVKDPARHERCFKEANEKGLRREPRWQFMLACMKK